MAAAAAASVGGASGVVQNTGEEPLYVNAKQYHRILKRREARTKWEAYNKNPKKVKVCIIKRIYCIKSSRV